MLTSTWDSILQKLGSMNAAYLFKSFILAFIVFSMAVFTQAKAEGPVQLVSIVDYLKATGQPSDMESRKAAFSKSFPDEVYTGTKEQNQRLLAAVSRVQKLLPIPLPSDKITGCTAFYGHAEISKFLTEAFKKNATKACQVTGEEEHAKTIRQSLQKIYTESKPADGKLFTPAEHKAIHDKAYKEAGCSKPSADLYGWIIVDASEWPESWIDFSIKQFGACTTNQ